MRAILIFLALAGCSESNTSMQSPDLATPGNPQNPDLATVMVPDLAGYTGSDGGLTASRPYHFYVPPGYDKNTPAPLVILLHGYTASGDEQELYFQLKPIADKHTFLYAYPDGTIDEFGNRFWNADDACCDIGKTGVDDVAYINAIIDDVQSKYNVDPKRIFLTGHSNGGFMSHRMACDAPRIAAIASFAGAVWKDPTKCNPAAPVSILEIHGDNDMVINYNGGSNAGLGEYPSAHDTVATWAAKNHCTGQLVDTGMTLDLDGEPVAPGAETKIEKYSSCDADVELWTIHNGTHVPMPLVYPTWGESIYGFLSSHPKP
jgi:polyhydroxybutyrate depolymerase